MAYNYTKLNLGFFADTSPLSKIWATENFEASKYRENRLHNFSFFIFGGPASSQSNRSWSRTPPKQNNHRHDSLVCREKSLHTHKVSTNRCRRLSLPVCTKSDAPPQAAGRLWRVTVEAMPTRRASASPSKPRVLTRQRLHCPAVTA